jgi:serine/threonine protein kinase
MLTPDETPEKEDIARPYDKKVDVWAIGCILFEIICGYSPFSGDTEYDIRHRIAGHSLHVTGNYEKTIFAATANLVNLEKEVDNAVKRLNHPVNKKTVSTTNERSLKNSMDYMELCSSMDDITITPKRKYAMSNINNDSDEEFIISDECKGLLRVIKRLLKVLLYPDPKYRYDAVAALNEFGEYRSSYDGIMESPIPLTVREMSGPAKTAFLNVIQTFWSACDRLRYEPNVVYLALYAWIRCISQSADLCKEFSLSTLLMACMRIASSYTGSNVKDLRAIRKLITNGKVEKSPRRECNAASSVLTVLSGRVWMLNPGDLRHLCLPCQRDTWNAEIEKVLFGIILELVMGSFTPPDANVVMERAKIRLRRNSMSRDIIMNYK